VSNRRHGGRASDAGESDADSKDQVDVFDQAGLALIPEITRDRLSIFLSHGAAVFTIADDPTFTDGLLWRMEPGLACLLGVRLLLRARDAGIDISFLQKTQCTHVVSRAAPRLRSSTCVTRLAVVHRFQ